MLPAQPPQRPRLITLLQNQGAQQDALGGSIDNWKPIATAWTIEWKSLAGREIFGGGQVKAEADSMITIRYMPSVPIGVGKWRLQYGSRLFDINYAVNLNEQNHFIQLLVKEIPAGA